MNVYDERMSLLLLNVDTVNLRVQFTDNLCYILVIFGLVGNMLGLFIFSSSRRTWRISSVYVYLATSSSVINLFCVIRYALILHSKSQNILRHLVGHVWLACKIYEISFSFRVISSWITLFWMFERLTCVSKRLRSLFYRWNTSQLKFVFPLMIIVFILGCVLGPPVYMYEPKMIEDRSMNSTRSTINSSCGVNPKASVKWKKYFYDVYLGPNHYTIRCFFSELFPSGMIILFNSYIIYHLIRTSRHLTQTNENQISEEQRRTTSWMNIVLILHSFLFLSSLLSHIAGHFMSVEAHETWWVLLTVLGSCSLNFYVYCLSGKAFRQKIIRFIQRLTTKSFHKLQIRKHRWEQHQQSPKDERFIYKNGPLVRTDQPGTYHSKCSQRSIRMNSLSRINEEESPV